MIYRSIGSYMSKKMRRKTNMLINRFVNILSDKLKLILYKKINTVKYDIYG